MSNTIGINIAGLNVNLDLDEIKTSSIKGLLYATDALSSAARTSFLMFVGAFGATSSSLLVADQNTAFTVGTIVSLGAGIGGAFTSASDTSKNYMSWPLERKNANENAKKIGGLVGLTGATFAGALLFNALVLADDAPTKTHMPITQPAETMSLIPK